MRSVDAAKFENLAFILTDRCNFDCSYCYEGRGTDRLAPATLARAVDIFRPYLDRDCLVTFYGGEPLLELDLIRSAVERFRSVPPPDGRGITFSVVTNGSLLDDAALEFLAGEGFRIELSFDGLAQDISRKAGTGDRLGEVVRRVLADPRLSLETNSVFTAETVGMLSGSVELLIGLGVPRFELAFAPQPPWTPAALLRLEEEMDRLVGLLVSRFDDPLEVPWVSLAAEARPGVRYCPAGVDRMAVSAQGTIWGCAVFAHYRRDELGTAGPREFCFGDVEAFAKDPRGAYAATIPAYGRLRMDRFSTPAGPCADCAEVEECWVCPLSAGLASGEIGRISDDGCRRSRILTAAKRRLRAELAGRGGGHVREEGPL